MEARGELVELAPKYQSALENFLREETGGHIGFSVASSARRQGVASAMLAGALGKARLLGLDHVALTCDVDNRASTRTIESGGGILVREGWCATRRARQSWYEITVPPDPT